MAGETGTEGDGGLDIASILSPATSGNTDTSGNEGGASGQSGSQEGFKFGGKTFQSQQAAEQHYNKQYGQFSESKSTLNQLKEAISRDPKLFSQFSKDPKWAPILAKLGVQQATEDLDRDLEEDAQGRQANTPEALYKEIQLERATSQLEREEWRFERGLGRSVSDEERQAVLKIIARASSLTYKEAWDLAFHDKMLKEAHAKALASTKPQGNRPPPLPPGIPGMKIDTKKNIGDMSNSEWRENLRKDLPELLNGGGR